MKKKIVMVLIALSAVIIAFGVVPKAISVYKHFNTNTELKEQLAAAKKEYGQACKSLEELNKTIASDGTSIDIDCYDKVAVTSEILSGDDTQLESINAYVVDSGKMLKIATLDNAADVANLPDDVCILEYALHADDADEFVQRLVDMPLLYDEITALPLTNQLYVRINFANGGSDNE